ncbi:MAG: aspartyl protease family protein [Pseudomonadota bacterium]
MGRFFLLIVMLTAACTSVRPPVDRVAALPGAYTAATRPELGVFIINTEINGTGPWPMLVDTGSTRSAIFPSAAQAIGLTWSSDEEVLVRGLAQIVARPVLRDVSIVIGPYSFDDLCLVGLPDREPPVFQGIIGLDILRRFVVVHDADRSQLVFVPREQFKPRILNRWNKLTFGPPPSGNESYGLGFVKARVAGQEITGLIDTGTSRTVSNWQAAAFSANVRALRRFLRQQWELAGANAPFRPQAVARYPDLQMGDFRWEAPLIILSDLATLDVLGADEAPFLIIGADMLGVRSFAFDAAGGSLIIEPAPPDDVRVIPTGGGSMIVNAPAF